MKDELTIGGSDVLANQELASGGAIEYDGFGSEGEDLFDWLCLGFGGGQFDGMLEGFVVRKYVLFFVKMTIDELYFICVFFLQFSWTSAYLEGLWRDGFHVESLFNLC